MKKTDFERYIRKIVKEELNKHMQVQVPALIGEVISGVLDRKLNELFRSAGNGSLLNEGIETDDEFRTLGNGPITSKMVSSMGRPRMSRGELAEMMGYGSSVSDGKLNIPDAVFTEQGVPVAVDPNKIPDFLIKNLNRDYSGFMKKLDSEIKKTRGA